MLKGKFHQNARQEVVRQGVIRRADLIDRAVARLANILEFLVGVDSAASAEVMREDE